MRGGIIPARREIANFLCRDVDEVRGIKALAARLDGYE
jgi:hypothetical protein